MSVCVHRHNTPSETPGNIQLSYPQFHTAGGCPAFRRPSICPSVCQLRSYPTISCAYANAASILAQKLSSPTSAANPAFSIIDLGCSWTWDNTIVIPRFLHTLCIFLSERNADISIAGTPRILIITTFTSGRAGRLAG